MKRISYPTEGGEWVMGDTREDEPGYWTIDTSQLDIPRKMRYNGDMDKHKFSTIRIWDDSRKIIRLIAAITDESMVGVMHRLAVSELARLQNQVEE